MATSAIIDKLSQIETEQHIPFENLLNGYVGESLLEGLEKNGYQEVMLLLNDNPFSLSAYAGKICQKFKFVYLENSRLREHDGEIPGQKLSDGMAEKILQDIQTAGETNELTILGQVESPEKDKWVLQLEVYLQKMYVPWTVVIERRKEDSLYPKEESFTKLMDKTKEIHYNHYPTEEQAAGHIFCILKDLELINEMEHYLYLYDSLKKDVMEGRKAAMALESLCEKANIQPEMARLLLVENYKKYTYMKKKWKIMLRRQKRNGPEWDEALDVIMQFVRPLWDAVCENKIFFSDWMPELGRYLD